MSIASGDSANVDKPVGRFLEALGIVMIGAGFEWLIFVDHPNWLVYSGFWIGGTATFFAGAFWEQLKFRMPERLVVSVETVALDFRYWLALILIVFVYMGTPVLLSQIKSIVRPIVKPVTVTTTPPSVAASGPVIARSATTTNGCPQAPLRWQEPAGAQTGPIGPILAAEFIWEFDQLPKPCAVKITSFERGELLSTFEWLLTYGRTGGNGGPPICELGSGDLPPPDADDPA